MNKLFKFIKFPKSHFTNKLKISNFEPLHFEDHYPVLWREVLSTIDQNVYDHYKTTPKLFGDFTIGCGNHTKLILDRYPNAHILGLDLDPGMVDYTYHKLAKYIDEERLGIINENYTSIREIDYLEPFFYKRVFPSDKKFDFVLLDLGFNSMQLKDNRKGLSFKMRDSELDMRYDTNDQNIAKGHDILNNCSELELIDIFRTYGEEKYYEPLVKNIVLFRDSKRFHTVDDFIQIIDKTFKAKSTDLYNNYTRLFQALRIAVNYEIFNVKRFLNKTFQCLEEGAIVSIITFHSLEDSTVKNFFKELEKLEFGKMIYKQGIKPSKIELEENSRSHSAILRTFKFKSK